MYRNSPVRGPRAKGIKVKNVLQVCLLVAVCFWLIFQVKRSHDKRKEFDASDNKGSLSSLTRSGEEIAKLGRKDLQPKLEKTGTEVQEDGHEQEDEDEQDEHDENKREEEEQDEHDENKREEEEQDEDKIEEEKDENRDVDIDGNEQEKPDVEIDREEVDVVGEEKDAEETDEKENDNVSEETDEKENDNANDNVSEEKDVQSEIVNEVSSVEDNQESATEHTHEGREENYKADDASSAVTHTGRTLGTENEIKNATVVALSENVGQTAENVTSTSPNTTVVQENDPEPLIDDVSPTSSIDSSENGPPSDTTLLTSQSTETQNVTAVTEESSNATDMSNSDVTESNESSSDPSKTELETETDNVTEGTEETIDPDEVQHDTIDSTDLTHLEEKDVRTDLGTLPDIETEGGNNEDAAAE